MGEGKGGVEWKHGGGDRRMRGGERWECGRKVWHLECCV